MDHPTGPGRNHDRLRHLPASAQIQSAVATVNRHTPEYVTEANKALREVGHPDAERLTGVGLRLQTAVDALDQWANGANQEAGQ